MTRALHAVTRADEAHARAYLTGVVHGYALTAADWHASDDGTATATPLPGVHLTHTPGAERPFELAVPCSRHGQHRTPVTWPQEADTALHAAAECSAQTATVHRITTLADEPGHDHDQPPRTPR